MKTITFLSILILLIGCISKNIDKIKKDEFITSDSIKGNKNTGDTLEKESVEIRNNEEFYSLAERIKLPASFNIGANNAYFGDLFDKKLPIINSQEIINDTIKKNIEDILKKHYCSKYDITQYLYNNEYAYYRMLGVIEGKGDFISKLIYFEAYSKEETRVGFLFMVNMNKKTGKNISNVVIASEIGAEAGIHYFITLRSRLTLNEQYKIIINQEYQVDDGIENNSFPENSKRTIVINTCTDCGNDTKELVSYTN